MPEQNAGAEREIGHYQTATSGGLDYASVPWRLWEKSKKLFWDPADLDFSQDAADWQAMTADERTRVAMSARGFMVGEEAVTLDIIPLLRCMSDLGRLEDTMYLAMFTMEEAKHTEMFRRWFDAVGLDPADLDQIVAEQQAARGERRGIFDGPLTEVMRRLDTDRSPQALLDASIIYNQFIEGVLAVAGYQRWDELFATMDKLPGLQAGLRLTQRDERRHIAYGTYLARRVLAENPELWEWFEERWAQLTRNLTGGYGAGEDGDAAQEGDAAQDGERQRELAEMAALYQRLAKRRLEALAVARSMRVAEVDASEIESFEPAELKHVG
jgi:ribonucleoside-diphosphate reductase beta chain